jgi:hypothetical protein
VSAIVRQRRYVSAPVGVYPAPVPPREQASPEPGPAAEELPTEADIRDEVDASLAAASPVADVRPEPAAAEAADPSLPRVPTLPEHRREAEDEAGAAEARPLDFDGERDDSPAEAVAPRRARSPVAGMIVGGLVGAVLGVAAGLLLLALTEGQGGLTERLSDPAALVAQISDPLALWNGVSDWLIRMSAVLVAGGFLLLGIGWGGRIRARRRA